MITAPDNLVDGSKRAAARVRGPHADRTVPARHCRHCGAPLAGDAAQAAGFCCAGCGYVFQMVQEHGLDGFYRIRDGVLAPAGGVVFEPRDYLWLARLQADAEKKAGPAELTLAVQGISCAGCVWLIEKVFHQQPGALQIETDAALGRMHLCWEPGRFDAPAFARLLQSFNYLAGPPGEEPEVPESRRLVRRIGLAAAFSMNVMLFTLPVYFGMAATSPFARLFATLALAFATLSLLTGGMYFVGRAARALQVGSMHIDLPIAVGILGAYGGSLYGWLSGHGQFVYFDFVAAFILLMLVGRWAQVAAVERNRRRLLHAADQPQPVRVETPAGVIERPVSAVQPGQVFVVRSGQVIPVESRLEATAATIGTAWISGEPDPRQFGAGALVPSGAVNLGRDDLRLRATETWAESLLAQLLRPATHSPYRNLRLEKIIRGYLIAIFLAAAGTGLGWWLVSHDGVRSAAAVTAVLVVSCPCAIGLAFPLADELATTALRRHGVFVRESDLWPRLARIRKIIFDKTGTLTLETPTLRNPSALLGLAPEARAALRVLARDNPHPVARALRESLLLLDPGSDLAPGGEIREEPGFGLTLSTPTGRWFLGRPGWRDSGVSNLPRGDHDTEFGRDGAVLARFKFTDALRPDAIPEIAALRARSLEIFVLSGDRETKVRGLITAFGLPDSHGVAGVTPREKATWLRAHDRRDTLMLGDGANDSLAFDVAFVRGTPVIHRGVLEAKADFYYLGRGISGIRRMFEINDARRRTQAWLLAFSVGYNAVAVGLAATGQINPLVAAILMPASSLITLLIVAGGLRGVNAAAIRNLVHDGRAAGAS